MSKNALGISLLLIVVALSCIPLFKNINNINLHPDWLQMLSYYRSARQSLLEYHQFPFRTHFFGGGYPLIANPQDGSLNPFFISILILGEVIGLKLNVFLAHIIGALGMYYLTRYVLKYNILGALFSSIVFILGGHIHRLLILGQAYASIIYWFLMPFALAFFIKSKENKKYLFYCALVLTIIVTQASLAFLPMLLFFVLFSLFEIVGYKKNRFIFYPSYLKNLFVVVIMVFLLGSIKILPMIELLSQDMRSSGGYNSFWGLSLTKIYATFFVHRFDFLSVGEYWSYFYLGYFPIILAAASFMVYWRKTKTYFFLLILFVLLAFSPKTNLDVFRFLHSLPFFSSIEAPVRYFVPGVIFILAVASGKVFSLLDKIKSKPILVFFVVALMFTTTDLFFTNRARENSFPFPVPGHKYVTEDSFVYAKNSKPGNKISKRIPINVFLTRVWEWTRPTQYELMLANIGKVNAYTNIHIAESVTPKYYVDWNEIDSLDPKNYTWYTNPDYKGEIYFLDKSDNNAELKRFSPNKIVVKVNLDEPDTLIINQNYDRYWRSSVGRLIDYQGLLAVKLDRQGSYPVDFRYVPVNFYSGLAISLISFILMVYYFRRTY